MGVARSCYTAPARFYVDGPVGKIRYFFAPPGAAVYTAPQVFHPLSQILQFKPTDGVGELCPSKRPWSNGATPMLAGGDAVHGTADDFAGLTVFSQPITLDQVPACRLPPAIGFSAKSTFLPANPAIAILAERDAIPPNPTMAFGADLSGTLLGDHKPNMAFMGSYAHVGSGSGSGSGSCGSGAHPGGSCLDAMNMDNGVDYTFNVCLDDPPGWLKFWLPDGWTADIAYKTNSGGDRAIGWYHGSCTELILIESTFEPLITFPYVHPGSDTWIIGWVTGGATGAGNYTVRITAS